MIWGQALPSHQGTAELDIHLWLSLICSYIHIDSCNKITLQFLFNTSTINHLKVSSFTIITITSICNKLIYKHNYNYSYCNSGGKHLVLTPLSYITCYVSYRMTIPWRGENMRLIFTGHLLTAHSDWWLQNYGETQKINVGMATPWCKHTNYSLPKLTGLKL